MVKVQFIDVTKLDHTIHFNVNTIDKLNQMFSNMKDEGIETNRLLSNFMRYCVNFTFNQKGYEKYIELQKGLKGEDDRI